MTVSFGADRYSYNRTPPSMYTHTIEGGFHSFCIQNRQSLAFVGIVAQTAKATNKAHHRCICILPMARFIRSASKINSHWRLWSLNFGLAYQCEIVNWYGRRDRSLCLSASPTTHIGNGRAWKPSPTNFDTHLHI